MPAEPRRTNAHLEPRVSSLETSVASLAVDVQQLAASLDRFASRTSDQFAELSRSLGSAGKTNWGTMFGGMSVLLIIIGALATAWIRPITVQAEADKELADTRARYYVDKYDHAINQVTINQNAITAVQEKLKEIETQFGWMTDVSNLRHRNLDRIISVLWERIFQKPLPSADLPNVGPMKDGK